MKICVCVSGQMRRFERPMKKLRDRLGEEDVTYIVSTWKQRGGKVYGAMNPAQIRRLLPERSAKWIPPQFFNGRLFWLLPEFEKTLIERASKARSVTEVDILSILPTAIVDIEDDSLPSGLSEAHPTVQNTYRMFYKINRADYIRQTMSAKNSYDFIIRIRPDTPDEFEFVKPEKQEIYLDWVDENAHLAGDQVFVANDDGARAFCKLQDIFLDCYKDGQKFDLHSRIWSHLVSSGYKLRQIRKLSHDPSDEHLTDNEFIEIVKNSIPGSPNPLEVRSLLLTLRWAMYGNVSDAVQAAECWSENPCALHAKYLATNNVFWSQAAQAAGRAAVQQGYFEFNSPWYDFIREHT